MELGLITRSIAKAAINLCSTMVGDLHSSLGETKGKDLYQLPHLVAPMFITFDKIICTPPGEKPPPLGVPYVEDLEYRKKRLKFRSIKDANVDLETTYSFSVNTSNINLLNWTLVGIPMVRPMDLRTFLQESAIRLGRCHCICLTRSTALHAILTHILHISTVCVVPCLRYLTCICHLTVGYEIPDAVLQQTPNDHPSKQLNYVFNMNVSKQVHFLVVILHPAKVCVLSS